MPVLSKKGIGDSAYWVALALAVGVFIALRAVSAAVPLERDEGEYAYFAQRILQGDVPYRDMFNQKPPSVFLAYLIPVALGGTSVAAIHLALYIWTAIAGFILYLIACEISNRTVAACTVLWFAILTIEPTCQALAANTEQWMLAPMTASVWCAVRGVRTRKRWWWFGCGVFAAAAFLFKQVAATNALFIAGYALFAWYARRSTLSCKSIIGYVAAASAGVLIIAVVPVAYFWANGALSDFLDAVLWHNLHYVAQTSLDEGLVGLREELARQAPSLWPAWILTVVGVCNWRYRAGSTTAFLLCWLSALFLGASIGLRFFPHYFVQLSPALALGAGLGTAQLCELARRGRPGFQWLALLIPAVVIAPTLVQNFRFFFATSSVEKAQLLYPGNPFDLSSEIAEYVRENTQDEDRVLIFGSEPQVLFLAQRRSATRYIIFYPLMAPGAEAEERQRDAWKEIVESDPRCIIMTELYASLLEQDTSPTFLRRNVAVMLGQHYVLGGARVWRDGVAKLILGERVASLLSGSEKVRRFDHEDMFIYFRRPPPVSKGG